MNIKKNDTEQQRSRLMHRLRVALVTALLLVVCCAGSAAADADVAVDGEIVITDGNTTIEAHTDASQNDKIEFTPSLVADTINLQTSKGALLVNGSQTNQTTIGVGSDLAGLPDLDSRSLPVEVETTQGYAEISPENLNNFSVDAAATIMYHGVTVGDGSREFTVISDAKVKLKAPTGLKNTKLLAVDNSNDEYLTSDTTDSNGTAEIVYSRTGTEFISLKQPAPITIDNFDPPDGEVTNRTKVFVDADVSSPDFAYDGYKHTTRIIDEATGYFNQETFNTNKTITLMITAENGKNNWSVSTETTAGITESSGILTFVTPDTLTIRNGSQPTQILTDNVSFTVRFISDNNIIERTTSTGAVSLAGLNRSKRYVVTVSPDDNSDFVYRRVIIDKIYKESSVYLLKDETATSAVKFELDDPTGEFPPTETELYVEKPITRDFDSDGTNETEYAVVAGDVFGSSGSFPMVVENGQRYRLRIESRDGSTSRVLGAYSTQNPERVPLTISRIKPSGDVDSGRAVTGSVEGDQVVVRYLDPSQQTESVEYRVVDDSGTTVVPNNTRTDNRFADIYDLPGGTNATYTVEWTITTESGNVTSGSFEAGRVVEGVSKRINADPAWLELLSYVAILASMGLVVLVSAQLAPLTGTAVASILTVIGTVAIPPPVLGIAGAISVLLPLGRR